MKLGLKKFTLRYLLLEVALLSVSFGAFAFALPRLAQPGIAPILVFCAGLVALGAALGGSTGRMADGAILALPILFISWASLSIGAVVILFLLSLL